MTASYPPFKLHKPDWALSDDVPLPPRKQWRRHAYLAAHPEMARSYWLGKTADQRFLQNFEMSMVDGKQQDVFLEGRLLPLPMHYSMLLRSRNQFFQNAQGVEGDKNYSLYAGPAKVPYGTGRTVNGIVVFDAPQVVKPGMESTVLMHADVVRMAGKSDRIVLSNGVPPFNLVDILNTGRSITFKGGSNCFYAYAKP